MCNNIKPAIAASVLQIPHITGQTKMGTMETNRAAGAKRGCPLAIERTCLHDSLAVLGGVLQRLVLFLHPSRRLLGVVHLVPASL